MFPKLKRIKKCKQIWTALIDAKAPLRKAIIEKADKDVIKALIEILINFLKCNLSVSKKKIVKLKRYKKKIRKIAHTKNVNHARKLLVQSGGAFLPIILGALASSLIGKVLD